MSLVRYFLMESPWSGTQRFGRRNLRGDLAELGVSRVSRGMQSRIIASQHEYWRLAMTPEPITSVRMRRARHQLVRVLVLVEKLRSPRARRALSFQEPAPSYRPRPLDFVPAGGK